MWLEPPNSGWPWSGGSSQAPKAPARKLRFRAGLVTPLRGERARAEPAHSHGFPVGAGSSSACSGASRRRTRKFGLRLRGFARLTSDPWRVRSSERLKLEHFADLAHASFRQSLPVTAVAGRCRRI